MMAIFRWCLTVLQHSYADALHILYGFVRLTDIFAIVFAWRPRVYCNLSPSFACLPQYSQKHTHPLPRYERTLNNICFGLRAEDLR